MTRHSTQGPHAPGRRDWFYSRSRVNARLRSLQRGIERELRMGSEAYWAMPHTYGAERWLGE